MRTIGAALAAAAIVVTGMSVGACSAPKAPDYQSIWTTSSSTSATPAPTEPPVPLSKYLEGIGVAGTAVEPSSLTDLRVSIPTPPGWGPRGNRDPAHHAVTISKGDSYPAAMLVVFRLRGDFNPAEAIKHANVDLPEKFTQLDASNADFNGFPSSMIQGSYELKGARMHSYNRTVFATGSAPENNRYLIQLIVTSLANQAVSDSDAIEGVIRGFVVAKK